jgi:hypothetical protein
VNTRQKTITRGDKSCEINQIKRQIRITPSQTHMYKYERGGVRPRRLRCRYQANGALPRINNLRSLTVRILIKRAHGARQTPRFNLPPCESSVLFVAARFYRGALFSSGCKVNIRITRAHTTGRLIKSVESTRRS